MGLGCPVGWGGDAQRGVRGCPERCAGLSREVCGAPRSVEGQGGQLCKGAWAESQNFVTTQRGRWSRCAQ